MSVDITKFICSSGELVCRMKVVQFYRVLQWFISGGGQFVLWQSTLKMGLIGCPETLVISYRSSLHNSPGECSSHLLCGGSLKSSMIKIDRKNVRVMTHYVLYSCYIVVCLFNTVIYVFLLLCICILIVCLCIFIVPASATLTEVFPCFFLSCKANARV